MNNSKDIRFRVYLSFLGMCFFGLMILYKGSMIHFREGKELRTLADSLHTRIEILQPERGNIYSEDGSLLSSSIPEFDLRIDFKSIPKDTFHTYIESLSKGLSAILKDRTWTEYKELLSNEYENQSRYFLLKKRATYAQYLSIKKLQPFRKGQNKGGFIAESHTKRINPFGLLANRVIGLHRENAQDIGIERRYDPYLKGAQGQRIARKNCRWHMDAGGWIRNRSGKWKRCTHHDRCQYSGCC
jgi:cell division protein FtsI (penicillin-binding protein 3)